MTEKKQICFKGNKKFRMYPLCCVNMDLIKKKDLFDRCITGEIKNTNEYVYEIGRISFLKSFDHQSKDDDHSNECEYTTIKKNKTPQQYITCI